MEARVTVSDGIALWTCVSGHGAPAVFLNGGPGMADYLAPVADALDGIVTAHRYEQRGCGRSSGAQELSLAAFVADIEALRAHWEIPRWYVVGHSWGVDLGLAYALWSEDERAKPAVPMATPEPMPPAAEPPSFE